jgi:hypothetical protein
MAPCLLPLNLSLSLSLSLNPSILSFACARAHSHTHTHTHMQFMEQGGDEFLEAKRSEVKELSDHIAALKVE